MQLRFDANQEFQLSAIEAAAGLFEGQPRIEADLRWALGSGFSAIANRLDLEDAALLTNLQATQATNGLPPDSELKFIAEPVGTADGAGTARFPNFSVEMETGTGKTYVYIRTCLELFRRYGFRKFIVVVPSVAVREGVLKTFAITEQHFKEHLDNLPYRYYAYKSENLSQVRQFALSDSVEFMVMTIDSFNKELNVIRQTTDRLQGETPIHLVQATRPILVLDEPQNMESEKSVAALAGLNPLFALRYSATHRNPYNLVHRLTPYDAYRQRLVKRIEVASVVQSDDENRPYIRLESIRAVKHTITARVAVHQLRRDGRIKETSVTVVPGDRLAEKANREDYAPYVVDTIDAGQGTLLFGNDVELRLGQAVGVDKEAIFEAQIAYTIEEHLRKQKKLKDLGLKVLSLFFIDRVDNYAQEDGIIRRLFDKAFERLKAGYADWRDVKPEDVCAAYFAQKRTQKGEVVLEDSATGRSKKDEEAYNLIMKDKERLLSFEEPVAFIFSHSALREGWDNPNVFQICTLNQTASEMKKRQEVGRGVRLAVNQEGERERDERVNVLTVIANESYERYVGSLQSEIEGEYGKDGLPPKPANARNRLTVKLRKRCMLSPEFKELWERIKHKTRYAVRINTEQVLADIVPAVDRLAIRAPRVTMTKASVGVAEEGRGFAAHQMTARRTMLDLTGRGGVPNLVDIMASVMETTAPEVRLTRRTLLEVFCRTAIRGAAMANPHEFATEAVKIIKQKLAEHLVRGIQYEKINQWYEMTLFKTDFDAWADLLVPARRGLYDHVEFDSETERKFVKDLERRADVRLYVKLPSWFIVETPVGRYNPDWAIVMENPEDPDGAKGKPLLYLVRETKKGEPRPSEQQKTDCGERHFKGALEVDYRVVTSASQLP